MAEAWILSAVRTAVGTAHKGTLRGTSALELARVAVDAARTRSGLEPERFDDVVFAESYYGGGDIARHAAIEAGLVNVGGQAVNRHCAGSLTSVANAAGSIIAGMDDVVIAGGVQSSSTAPVQRWRVPGTEEYLEPWWSPTHPDSPTAPNRDMTITVGWNTAQAIGISREEMDRWAYRSHQRAVAAIDDGTFAEEIVPVKVTLPDGSATEFAVDEHPRRDSTLEKLASLKPLHPEIEGFSITAGNSSGVNDAAAALVLGNADTARSYGGTPFGRVRGWAWTAVPPERTGAAVLDVIPKVLRRTGLSIKDIALWEINEAFASVPVAACRELALDEEKVNIHGSGCSIGHPTAASGARMLTTLVHDLRRRGGGLGIAAMCAGGGQAGAVLVEC
ncbi:thiolase family protein [Amycolatopsis thermophila]|uniref:Probable acetyl-CoA acetyltransferase n=1 Tax=Amycolatopsis thermophila TaxID=206084 RepID=A0ABU0F546_9PSEU|nr:thiolase family protein [Amycolatopsis thermophila]MDQ0382709.1 acetyl-CoA C-acetyltransferase [Amycolatopsis thermophila]